MIASTEKPSSAQPECGACRHAWPHPELEHIECRRFPQPVHKHTLDYCGEFITRKEQRHDGN